MIIGDPWEWLLSPFSSETFFREHHRRAPLLLTDRSADRYHALFSMRDVEQIAHVAPERMQGSLRLQKGLEVGVLGPGPLAGQLASGFREGFTIRIDSVERFAPSLVDLQRPLEAWLEGEVHFNLYLSPTGNALFPPHADHHDSLILQIDGEKRWSVFDDRPELIAASLRREPPPDPERLGPPVMTVTLRPGDLLYLPLGRFHAAQADERSSLHLTLGLYPYTGGKLLLDVLGELAASEPMFLEPIDAWPVEARESRIEALLAAVAERTDVEQRKLQHKARRVGEMRLLPRDLFAEHAPDRAYQKRPGSIAVVTTGASGVVLAFPEGELRAPARAEAALRFVAGRSEPFTAADLPDDLPLESRELLIQRLVSAGLLIPAPRAP